MTKALFMLDSNRNTLIEHLANSNKIVRYVMNNE